MKQCNLNAVRCFTARIPFFLLQRLIKYKCHLGVGFIVTLAYALKTCVSTGDSSSCRKQVGAEKFNYSPEISIMQLEERKNNRPLPILDVFSKRL